MNGKLGLLDELRFERPSEDNQSWRVAGISIIGFVIVATSGARLCFPIRECG